MPPPLTPAEVEVPPFNISFTPHHDPIISDIVSRPNDNNGDKSSLDTKSSGNSNILSDNAVRRRLDDANDAVDDITHPLGPSRGPGSATR